MEILKNLNQSHLVYPNEGHPLYN